MALFQKSVLRKHLNELNRELVTTAYQRFRNHFANTAKQANIRDAKEEQYQEGFLRELFVDVLGYTLNPAPDFNLTTEYKNEKDSKKADGAVLKNGAAIAVIELKGTDTVDLDHVETQAFGYKNNQKGCVYVITSNFEKLRFYIEDSVEHLEFDLFQLSAEEFDLLYLCLQKDNLLASLPAAIKAASVNEEQNVTKKLYNDYSSFKRKLYLNITERNPQFDKVVLYKKTQKLLDRFLFILFAEDKQLLPPNSIREILNQWEQLKALDEHVPLYDRYKKYFGYMNTGHKGKQHDIFAYNGGLFAPDEVLDNITVDDQLLHDSTFALSQYDYETEVDVNILGHIFEHSLNDVDAVTAEVEGKQIEKDKTRRKKDGVFYTPKYITKYIVENTVGKLCEEKKTELEIKDEDYSGGKKKKDKKALNDKLETYRKWLLELTILDPACGSGAFLNQALEFLITEHRKVDELRSKLFEDSMVLSDVENHILENNLYGVDLNEESIEIAKLSLWLRTAKRGRKLSSLNYNIKCGNSLIDDPAVAGDKAFNWQKEFETVFAKGGFDVVIGNPPYVFAREKISQAEKEYYTANYTSADYQVNTYLLFIERTVELIKPTARYGLIVPNAWLMVYSGIGLRKYLLEICKIDEIINLEGYSFEGVNVETIIIIATKKNYTDNAIKVFTSLNREFKFSHTKQQEDFKLNDGYEFKVFADDSSSLILQKLKKGSEKLDDLVDVKAGLQAYEKDKGEPKQTEADVINRPYDYRYKFDENTHRYLDGKDVNRYYLSWSGQYLRYGKHLAAPRTFNLFEGKKLIVREITGKYPKSIIATFSDELYLYNRSNIAVIERPGNEISLRYVLAVLNSSLMSYYFMKNTAKAVRKMFPKVILNDLRLFPIKAIGKDEQMPFIERADKMLSLNKDLQTIQFQFLTLLQSKFELPKLSNKLQEWYELDFKSFLKELEKAKVKMSLAQEAEWLPYFTEQKQKALTLKTEIDKTDKEIDKMVYELYGLTEEEIKIVESK